MFKYLETVTQDLLMVCIVSVLLYCHSELQLGKKGALIHRIGILAIVVFSAVKAYLQNTTKLIRADDWNTVTYYVLLIAAIVFLVSLLLQRIRVFRWVGAVSGTLTGAAVIFYELPSVMAYPWNFNIGDNGVFSTEFGRRFAGWVLALLLMYIIARVLSWCVRTLKSPSLTSLSAALITLVCGSRIFGLLLRNWISRGSRRWPYFISKDHPWAFPFAKFVLNNEGFFVFLALAVAIIIPLVLFFRSTKVRDPYDNPAQLRKLRKHNRTRRHYAMAFAVCSVLVVLTMTVVHAMNNQVITLSEPEEYTLTADNTEFHISIESVNDGHLHRFEYKTPSGTAVRWIIIKKPNSASFGIGLDACEVCGTAGYYERDGNVVCKRCDVVMNINTIGFKGGCNPIPLSYKIENGEIIFMMDDILAAESSF